MKILLSFCVVFFCFLAMTQKEYLVLDKDTDAPIAFVKAIDNEENIYYSDIDGKFEFLNSTQTISLRFFGYKDTTYHLNSIVENNYLYLRSDAQSYDEVVIVPGENPANRIIRNTIDKRKENHPLKELGFTCDFYNKFLVTNSDEFNLDTTKARSESEKRTIAFFSKQHVFISESVGSKTFYPPVYEKDVISSYKTSGFKNPMFATLGNQMQSFSFYDNQFSILGEEYINPIAEGGLRRYLFILEDTTVIENDSTFVIRFQPRKGKSFSGLKGFLYINTNNWAIQKVIAEPFDKKTISIKIIQEYKFINNKKWFPDKLNAEFSLNNVTINDSTGVVFRNSMYISNINFDIPKQKGFNAVKLEVEEEAVDKIKILDTMRVTQLTARDTLTYYRIDSISKADDIEGKLALFTALSEGKVPLGYVNLPLERVIDFNLFEGYRLGLGLETSDKVSKHFTTGGYFAYGFKDKQWKWGGYSTVDLYKKRQIELHLKYQEDVELRAVDRYFNKNFDLNTNEIYRDFYVNQMERQRIGEILLSGLVTPNFKVRVFANYQRRWILDNYKFSPYHPLILPVQDKFNQAIIGAEINWNIREKIMQVGTKRISLGTKLPRLKFKIEKGISNVWESNYNFTRLNFQLEENVSIRGWGSLSILSNSGITVGDTPLSFAQQPIGTGGDWNLTVKNSFETMLPSSFFADRKTDLFFRFTFNKIKTNVKWTSPQVVVHSVVGFGRLTNMNSHKNLQFKDYSKGYTESGLIIDHLLNSGFSSLGLGVFYHYGNYATPYVEDNLTYKVSFKLNL
ncbi:MAG: DUF5686 family protein [Lishizhenia sp.]